MLRRGVYWSSCPSTEDLRAMAEKGLTAVVDLTEGECRYSVPQGVERVSFPIPDFSFRSPESVLVGAVEPVRRVVAGGGNVLIHCMGGIGRSGTLAAMLLIALDGLTLEGALKRVRELGGGPQVPAQQIALAWFERNLHALGYGEFLALSRTLHKAEVGVDYVSSRVNILLDILSALDLVNSLDGVAALYRHYAGTLTLAGTPGRETVSVIEQSVGPGVLDTAERIFRLTEFTGNVFIGEGVYLGTERLDGKALLLLNGFVAADRVAKLREALRGDNVLNRLVDVEERYDF